MSKLNSLIAFVLIAVLACACATAKKPEPSKAYSEDLSTYLPEIDTVTLKEETKASFRTTTENIDPDFDVTTTLNQKLDTLADNNSEISYVNGYSIQIYSGSSSEEAYQARDTARDILPEIRTKVQYQQPVYKVRVGTFTERLEVQRTLLKLKQEFPGAIAVPERIKVN